jgi:hypothetical protein
MVKVFKQVSAVLSKAEFAKLDWQSFPGSTADFRSLRSKILGMDEGATFRGQEGYARFADREEYQGAMQKAFAQVSAVLSKAEFAKLGWQQFPGSTAEFRAIRGWLKSNGDHIKGKGGFERLLFDLQLKPGTNVVRQINAALSEAELIDLGWNRQLYKFLKSKLGSPCEQGFLDDSQR